MTTIITPFDPRNATEAEYTAFHRFECRIAAERCPDERAPSLEATIFGLKNLPRDAEVRIWALWDERCHCILGQATAGVLFGSCDGSVAQADIAIVPELRRRGVGTRLLAIITTFAEEQDRRRLLFRTHETVPSGVAFVKRLGAAPRMSVQKNGDLHLGITANTSALWQIEVEHVWQHLASRRIVSRMEAPPMA